MTAPSLSGTEASKPVVLVVEDDPGIRDLISLVLAEAGYEVRLAEHGEDGLDHLRREPLPDLIMTDLLMPVLDG